MSKSEDYLDQLLKGVSPEDVGKEEMQEDALEENIFSDILEEFADSNTVKEVEENFAEDTLSDGFSEEEIVDEPFADEMFAEEDIFGDDIFDDEFLDDEFLKEFEMEMAKLENETMETGDEDDVLSLFDDLDSIVSGAKEQMEAVAEAASVSEPEVVLEPEIAEEAEMSVESNLEEISEPEAVSEPEAIVEEVPVMEEGFSFADLFAEDGGSSSEEPQEDADVLKILEGLDGIDLELDEEGNGTSAEEDQDFSALEGFLAASAADNHTGNSDFGADNFAFDEEPSEEAEEPKAKKGKKGKKEKNEGEKTGFLNKLGLILFGEDDEDEEEEPKKKNENDAMSEIGEITIGVASEDDLALFGEYSGGTSSAPVVEEKVDKKAEKKALKEKKKQEKKEKQEKAKKEKKAKPKKEKKPKPPKVPDKTPPLPKKPVILIFLMVASLVALILIGADLLGYANHLTNAKNQYVKKNYSEAFAEISGMEMKEEDLELYNKYHIMAMVSVELEAYESLASQGFYDMALDSLVRTVGRAEKYRADAESYGCIQELNELETKAEEILSQNFGVSREEALEFYAYRSKAEYSKAINAIIKELGLER